MATTAYCGISEKRGVVRRAIEDGLYDFRTLHRAPCTVCRVGGQGSRTCDEEKKKKKKKEGALAS